MKKQPGFFQEQDGARSSRRMFAFLYTVCSIACLIIAAVNGSMAGVWAGIAALSGTLITSGYTTIESITRLLASIKGKSCGKE